MSNINWGEIANVNIEDRKQRDYREWFHVAQDMVDFVDFIREHLPSGLMEEIDELWEKHNE